MLRIVSGGQTGVDRAALDVALRRNISCGGWCPQGRTAEDGVIPAHYPLRELPGGSYDERTKMNVADTDGTVIIYFGTPSGGTRDTLRYSQTLDKPYLLLDGDEVSAARAAERIVEFLKELPGETLNFAGPRASGEPRAYDYTSKVVENMLRLYEHAQ